MASITALGIPEIVTHVVKMTESRAELARCCRVNRVWHDSAISHLWEVAPSCSTLVELHRQDVVRKYLPHIKKQAIVVDDMKSMAERRFRYVLARGVLARIQIVALSLALPPSFPLNANVTNVLGSSLRILQLPKSWYGEKVFTWVERCTPHLEVLIVKPQNTSHDISGDRKLKFLKNVPSLHYCKGLDTPDSNGDILRHMLCRKDLRILDLRLNEKTQPIILSEIASTSYMTVKSLSVVLDDHRRPSLVKVLQSMPGLQALSMTGAIDATRMIELAAYSSQLTELACQLRLSGDGHERFGEAYRALGKHCPRLRSLQISSLSSIDEPRTLKGSLRLIGHALPSIERLSLPLRLPLEDLITLHTNEDLPRLEQLEVRALTVESDEFLGLVHSAQTLRRIRATHRLSPSCGPVRFPRLRYLNMGSTGLFMSNASGLADSESVIDWVLDAMPKLCNVQYDSMDDIQRAAFARFEAKLQKRPQTEPPNDVHDRILHEIYRAGVRQLARQGKDEAQSSSRTVA